MKKALKIQDEQYINMDNIVEFTFYGESISIITSSDDIIYFLSTNPQSDGSCGYTNISIQEIKRIKRELSTFMGLGK